MGDPEQNLFVPFKIKFVVNNEPTGNFTPLNPEVIPCSKGLSVSNFFYPMCIKKSGEIARNYVETLVVSQMLLFVNQNYLRS